MELRNLEEGKKYIIRNVMAKDQLGGAEGTTKTRRGGQRSKRGEKMSCIAPEKKNG